MSEPPKVYLIEIYSIAGDLKDRKIAQTWDDVVAALDFGEDYYDEMPNIRVNITPVEVVG